MENWTCLLLQKCNFTRKGENLKNSVKGEDPGTRINPSLPFFKEKNPQFYFFYKKIK